ncbi:MAG: hypothetical protein K0S56_1443 [Microvirga sp.]|jgi:hypothetical protein|nr:hypothetical protein [Microvirga sp.]
MIDPETIEEWEECDGEAVSCYGFDPDTGEWAWGWVPLENIEENGRTDILDALFPVRREGAV